MNPDHEKLNSEMEAQLVIVFDIKGEHFEPSTSI